MQKNAANSSQKIQVSLAAKCRTESRKVHLSMHWFVEDPIQCRRLQCIERHICSYAGLKKLHGSSSFQKRHSTCGFVGHPHTLSFWPSRRELTTIKIPKNKSAALDSPKHLWPWTTFRILIESLWDPSIKDLFSSHIGISDVFFPDSRKICFCFFCCFCLWQFWMNCSGQSHIQGWSAAIKHITQVLIQGTSSSGWCEFEPLQKRCPFLLYYWREHCSQNLEKKRSKKMDLRAIIC